VNGILQPGKKIAIELTTKVVQMPKADTPIRNVACLLISDEEPICDEDTAGTPTIEKQLI